MEYLDEVIFPTMEKFVDKLIDFIDKEEYSTCAIIGDTNFITCALGIFFNKYNLDAEYIHMDKHTNNSLFQLVIDNEYKINVQSVLGFNNDYILNNAEIQFISECVPLEYITFLERNSCPFQHALIGQIDDIESLSILKKEFPPPQINIHKLSTLEWPFDLFF